MAASGAAETPGSVGKLGPRPNNPVVSFNLNCQCVFQNKDRILPSSWGGSNKNLICCEIISMSNHMFVRRHNNYILFTSPLLM